MHDYRDSWGVEVVIPEDWTLRDDIAGIGSNRRGTGSAKVYPERKQGVIIEKSDKNTSKTLQ